MRNITLAIVASFLLVACGDYTGDTTYETDNSTSYGEGTVLICDNSTCVEAPPEYDNGDGNATVGVYDADYNQVECNAAGFFYCTIENMCLNQPRTSGSCN